MAMPERICRSVPVPSSSVELEDLLLFFTAWQSFTLTTRRSFLQKLVKVHRSPPAEARSPAGQAARWPPSAAFSSPASSFWMSMRGRGSRPAHLHICGGGSPHLRKLPGGAFGAGADLPKELRCRSWA